MANYSDPCDSNLTHQSVAGALRDALFILIASVGVVHNGIFITVARRLEWFKSYQFYLICNQIIADLTTGLICVNSCILTMIHNILDIDLCKFINRSSVFWFILALPFRCALNCSQKSAVIVGFDRLFLIGYPHKWIKLTARYRFALIAVAWVWAIAEEALPIACFLEPTERWDACRDTINDFYKYSWLVNSLVLMIVYTVLASASSTFCERAVYGNKALHVFGSRLDQVQRDIFTRVRLLALLNVGSHMLMILALFLIWFDLSEAMCVALCYTILPIYIFAWRDEKVRDELKKILPCTCGARIFCRKDVECTDVYVIKL